MSPFGSVQDYLIDPSELRCLDYFCAKTVFELAEFDYKSEFWSILIPQAARHEPVIHHALLALSATHERFRRGDVDLCRPWVQDREKFALKHYNKAIQLLLKPPDGQPKPIDVCLLGCLLFASIEALRGHFQSANKHALSGIRILSEQAVNEGRYSSIKSQRFADLDGLEELFNRLEMSRIAMVGSAPVEFKQRAKKAMTGFSATIPPCFHSFEEANNSLQYQVAAYEHYASEIIRCSKTGQTLPSPQVQYHLNQLVSWDHAFEAYIHGRPRDTQLFKQAQILRIHQSFSLLSVLNTDEDGIPSEMGFDNHLPLFRHVLSLAQQVVQNDGAELGRASTPSFSFSMNIVAPLYGIAHHCRDPIVRREAVKLLKDTRRQEGIWDGEKAGLLAEVLIEIEERGLDPVRDASDVPESVRINDINIEFNEDGKVSKVGYKQGNVLDQDLWFQEDIQSELMKS